MEERDGPTVRGSSRSLVGRVAVWVLVALTVTPLVVALVAPTLQREDPGTTFDTSGLKAKVSHECAVPTDQLFDETVDSIGASWAWVDAAGVRRVATLSFQGHGISCGR